MKKNLFFLINIMLAFLVVFAVSCSKKTNIHPLAPEDIFTSTSTAILWPSNTAIATNTPLLPTITFTETSIISTSTITETAMLPVSPSFTPTFTQTFTSTRTTTLTPVASPTNSGTIADTSTSTRTATPTFILSSTFTATITDTATESATGTYTPFYSPTDTATDTPVYTPTSTETETPNISPTDTDTPVDTDTDTPTEVDTATATPTSTPTVTETISVNGPPWPFDTTTMGFTNDIYSDLACTSVTWDGNALNARTGPGSIYGAFDFTASATVQGYVLLDRSSSPVNMTGKTLNVWVNVPAAIAGQGYGLQLVAKLPGWNAKWFNLDNPGWQLFSFDVNAAGVTEVGVMISRNSSGVAYVGNIQIDEMYLSDMTPPGPPWTFDGNMEGFAYKSAEPGITGLAWNSNPAGITHGAGSLAMSTDFSSGTGATGNMAMDPSPSLNLTGKVLSIWLDVPASIAGQGWGIQVYALTGAGYTWNAQWFNLDNPGWQLFSWTVPALTDVRQIGLQILRNSSPVSYSGVMYTDEWTVTDAPVPTATFTVTATNTPVITATDTPVNTETNTPLNTATDTPMMTATDTPVNTETSTPLNTATDTPVITATDTPVSTETSTPLNTATDTPVITATDTPVNTETSTLLNTATDTPVITATDTPVNTETSTPLNTATDTPVITATDTPVSTETSTPLNTATDTPVITATDTPVNTETSTPLNTATDTPMMTATDTPVNTETSTPLNTATDTPMMTATDTPVNTATDTPLNTATDTPPMTATDTPVNTATDTPLNTATDTPVSTATDTPVSSPTSTATATMTSTQITVSGPPWPFDTTTMGFTNDIYTDLACTSVTWDGNALNAQTGPGSIYGTFDFTASATVQGYILLDRSSSPINMTNKTLNVWVNVPAAIAGQGYGLQLVAKLPGWNAKWFNLDNPGWQLFSFDVNAAGVTEVGVMISRNSSGVAYAGNIQIDEMYLSDMTPPGPPWTFDGNMEGFVYSGTEPGITGIAWNSNPAGITHGAGSLAMAADFSSGAGVTGNIHKDLSPALDLTGKTYAIWLDVPASIAGKGWGIQLVALTGAGYTWNAQWFNLDTAGYQKFSWDIAALTDVRQVGLQILRNGSTTSYSGTIYTDEWTITTTPVAGPAIYNFNAGAQGWTNDIYTDLAVTGLAWDSNAANAYAGAGSIVCTSDFTASLTAQGYVFVDLASSPIDLTGMTYEVWMNVPAGMVGYGAQLAYKTGAGKAWHATWVNLTASGWQRLSCIANIADVQELGIQFVRNSAPTGYSGTFNLDEITYY